MTQAFLPSARKYRPQTWKEIIGQDATSIVLQRMVAFNKIPSAILFTGQRGTGKTTTARVLAKTLNCDTLADQIARGLQEVEPCNRCSSCIDITTGRSDDVIEIDAASHNGVDDAKKLEGIAMLTPSQGKWRIIIIDEAHGLSTQAQNSLLILFENPPPAFLPILCTTNPEKVIATIKSRTSIYQIRPIRSDGITASLSRIFADANQPITPEALATIVNQAQGSLRDVQQTADQVVALACGALVDEDFLETALGMATSNLYRMVAGALATAWDDGPGPWFTAVAEWQSSGVDLSQLFFTVLIGLIRDLRIAMCFANQPECPIAYYSGIPHAVFVERSKYTERDLDILLEAWDDVSKHFGISGMFDRIILEMFFMRAWNVKRYEST